MTLDSAKKRSASGGWVDVKFDANKLFTDAVAALHSGLAPWLVFALVALIMSPMIIPAISNAIAQQRSLSIDREKGLLKIRNSRADRRKRLQPPGSPGGSA